MQDDWRRFEEAFGPITVQERLEVAIAATLGHGSGKKLRDFMVWSTGDTSADDIVARLESMAKRTPKEAT
jgi:hypothetical protein